MIDTMKYLIAFIKPLSFFPALLIMYLIFSFSGQNGEVSANLSYKVSYKIVETGNTLMNLGMDESTVQYHAERIHPKVRKLAHMTEYFFLAVAVSFPLYVYNLRGLALVFLAGALCVGFACLDEFHQSFVAGRSAAARDVMIDSIGSFAGILLVQIFCWIVLRLMPAKKKKRRRTSA